MQGCKNVMLFGVVCIKALIAISQEPSAALSFLPVGSPSLCRCSKLTLSFQLSCLFLYCLSCYCLHFFFPHVVCIQCFASTGGEHELIFLVQLLGYLSSGPISEAQTLFIPSVFENFGLFCFCFFFKFGHRAKILSYLQSHRCKY